MLYGTKAGLMGENFDSIHRMLAIQNFHTNLFLLINVAIFCKSFKINMSKSCSVKGLCNIVGNYIVLMG